MIYSLSFLCSSQEREDLRKKINASNEEIRKLKIEVSNLNTTCNQVK